MEALLNQNRLSCAFVIFDLRGGMAVAQNSPSEFVATNQFRRYG